MTTSINENKQVEIPTGEYAKVFIRPKESIGPISTRNILNYLGNVFKVIKDTDRSVVVFLPANIDVIVVKPSGEVQVY